jgi:hypothetical protein
MEKHHSIRFLVDQGVFLNIKNNDNETPEDEARIKRKTDIVELIQMKRIQLKCHTYSCLLHKWMMIDKHEVCNNKIAFA